MAPGDPRLISPRRPGTTSDGPAVGRLSAGLLVPFLPWQHEAADLIGETDPSSGRRTRGRVVLTVQRQAGKTELVKAVMLDRALLRAPSQRIWYTAQSGLYARDKWAALATSISAPGSPLAGYVAVRWSKGDECMTFPNGSTIRPFPPTRDALHSQQGDLVILDECWVHDPVRGAELLQAASPIMATRPGAQLVLCSTMGTAASTWWHGWIDLGRKGDPAVTYIEYGIGDDGDPDDLDAVIDAHPGVSGGLIAAEYLRGERAVLSRNEFARAYGNARTASDERYIDRIVWNAAATDDAPAAGIPFALAGAVAADRSRSAIVACAEGIAEVIESGPGVDWCGPRLVDLVRKWRPPAVDVHRAGPSGTLRDDLIRAGITPADTPSVDYATACVGLLDRLRSGSLRYRIHASLDAAADAAVPVPTGDGSWRWGRRASGGPIPEIEALTLASWLDEHRPRPRPRPRVISTAAAD
jgi:hypothetical protein